MCLKVENSFSKDDEVVASSGLTLFIFDDIGCLTYIPSRFCSQIPHAAINLREHTISKHDVCEDG